MITNNEKNQIRSIITQPEWKSVEIIRDQLIAEIRSQPKKKDTEWETASTTVFDEGQVEGINRLFQELLKTQL